MFEFSDVERIEVVKGPQGTLYGRNATGGAIRVVTKDVDDEFGGSLSVSAGNYNYYNFSGTVSVPISDTFGARITALTKQRDGYVDNIFPGGKSELDDEDFKAFRGKFRWEMADNTTARLTLDYWERNDLYGIDVVDLSPPGLNTGIVAGGISGASRDKAATAINEKNEGDEFSAQLRFDVVLDYFDVVSVTTYSELEQVFGTDADGTSTAVVDAYASEDEDAFSQEFQLVSNDGESLEWLLGAYFYNSDANYDAQVDVGLPFIISQSLQNVETTAWAVFGQATWNFSENWAVTLGGRWNEEKKR